MHLVGLYTYCKTMHGAYNVKYNKQNTVDSAYGVFLLPVPSNNSDSSTNSALAALNIQVTVPFRYAVFTHFKLTLTLLTSRI